MATSHNSASVAGIGVRALLGIVLVIAALGFGASARAFAIYTGNGAGNDPGQTNSASVTFDLFVSGPTTNLIVTLANTATYKPNDPADMLTAVFFSIVGDPTLTRVSGLLSLGSDVANTGTNVTIAGGVIGGSWSYLSGLNHAPGNANEGISSAGFNLFGPKNVFPGAAIPNDSPVPGGVGGGLTTATDDGSGYNGGLLGRPFIRSSAVFTLGEVPGSFTLSDISGIMFQYGTALWIEPGLPGLLLIPEPGSAMLTGWGFLLLALLSRRCARRSP